MKTIGLLGGMSWESTLGYYRAINEGIKKMLGGLHSAKVAMYSVDFEPIEKLQHAGDWEGTAKILIKAAQNVQAAGADFYKGRLISNYGLKVLVPNENDRQIVHNIIYQELCLGKIESDSKAEYLRIINTLASQGAEAVILGCTEIGMLVNQIDTNVRLLDTTAIHAGKAVKYATT